MCVVSYNLKKLYKLNIVRTFTTLLPQCCKTEPRMDPCRHFPVRNPPRRVVLWYPPVNWVTTSRLGCVLLCFDARWEVKQTFPHLGRRSCSLLRAPVCVSQNAVQPAAASWLEEKGAFFVMRWKWLGLVVIYLVYFCYHCLVSLVAIWSPDNVG